MDYSDQFKSVFLEAISHYRPPPMLSLSEWADQYAYLSPESSHQAGRWKTLPYQKEILDAFTDIRIDKITVMKSARIGYTKALNHVLGYHIHHSPKSVLMVQPTVEDAQGYSKEELSPMLRDTPVLQGIVSEAKTRDSNNTILKKTYPGGFITLVGANSARGFRRISVPVVLFDEVDGYPPTAGTEGDQIKLGTKRAEWFWDRKIAIGSTPTVKGLSRVEKSYNESDQRKYFVPCPYCGEFQTIEFENIKWPDGEPQKAALKCVKCRKLIPHSKKRLMVERGEWRAGKPFLGHAGFFIWSGYSFAPNATWGHIAAEFLESKDDIERLKTFKNTTLGQVWEDKGDQPNWSRLKARCEPYDPMTIPKRGVLLVAGVDVQDNRLAVKVEAYGEGEESWCIYWVELYGDPGGDELWDQLDTLLNRPFRHYSGADIYICSVGVDSGGHHTQRVYNYCRKRSPRIFALKGASQSGKPVLGRPSTPDVNWKGEVIKNGVQLWPIGTDTAKSLIYNRLQMEKPGPGYFHFYIGLDDDFFQQMTSEKKTTRFVKGYPKPEWVKIGPRNEALDCTVYAYAAALRAGLVSINWDQLRPVVIDKKPMPQKKGRRVLSRGIDAQK